MKTKGLVPKTKAARAVKGLKKRPSETKLRSQAVGGAARKAPLQTSPGKVHVPVGKTPSVGRAVEPVVLVRPKATRAVRAFEQAIKIFNRHDFERARAAFESVIERFPDEAEVLVRARAYLTICEQRLGHSPATPRTAEALYDRGVIELNRGQIGQAVLLFEKALRLEPNADHIVYALASAYAKGGDIERALETLKQCIRKNETYRIHARRDPDFRGLYTCVEFQKLVGLEVVE